MGKVFTQASVSLDGYISGPGQTGFDRLFAWCTAGTVATPTADPDRLTYLTSEATARYLRELQERIGACVVGRNLFDHRSSTAGGGWACWRRRLDPRDRAHRWPRDGRAIRARTECV